MATYSDINNDQLDTLVKKEAGLGSRGTGFLVTSEVYPSIDNVPSNKVFLTNLPTVAPATSTGEVMKHFAVADGGVGAVRLTRERDDGNGLTWLLFPEWVSFHASGADDGVKNATIYTDICTSRDGASYTFMFFSADGTRMLPTGPYAPSVQPSAGIVRFGAALPAGNGGDTVETSPYCCFFRRVGDTLADVPWSDLASGSKVADGTFCTMLEQAFNDA